MNEHESFSDSIYEQQAYLAESELCSFTVAAEIVRPGAGEIVDARG